MFVMQMRENSGAKNCLGQEAPTVNEARGIFEAYLGKHPDAFENSAGLIAAMSLLFAHPRP